MYRDTGWNGVQCTINGEFKRGDRAINTRKKDYWWYIRITINGKSFEKGCIGLIRAAWKDAIDNGEVCWEEIKKIKHRTNIQNALMEFRPTVVHDIECTRNAIFRRNGHLLTLIKRKSVTGYKHRMTIGIGIAGKSIHLKADRLLAKAWFPTIYNDSLRILYKDKNVENLHIDNLIFCEEENFLKYVHEGSGGKPMTIDESKEILERMIKEFSLQKNYIETGDFSEITKYIQEDLYPRLVKYAIRKLQSINNAEMCASDVVASLYERIANNRPLYHWWKYVCFMVAHYKRHGEAIDKRLQPKIKIEVEQLKLNAYETKQFI